MNLKRITFSIGLVAISITIRPDPSHAFNFIPACEEPKTCIVAKIISEGLNQPQLGQLMIAREAVTRGSTNTDARTYTGIKVAEGLELQRLSNGASLEEWRTRPNLHHWRAYFDLDNYTRELGQTKTSVLERIASKALDEAGRYRIAHYDCAACPRASWWDIKSSCPWDPFVLGSQRYCSIDPIPGIANRENDGIANEEPLAIEWSVDDVEPTLLHGEDHEINYWRPNGTKW